MQINIHKDHRALFLSAALIALVLGSFFAWDQAQAQSRDYDYVRSYSSGDGRSQIEFRSRTSSDSDTSIQNSVSAYSNAVSNYMDASYESTTFRTSLRGSEEVPPVSTDTSGDAEFAVASDEETIDFELDVFDGDDITAAHLHCAPEGVNGPVAVLLFSSGNGVDIDGELASGEITDGDITANCASISDVDDLVAEIKDGDIYVNVHSEAYPDGLIRGQLGDSNDDDDEDDTDEDDLPPSHLFDRIEELLERIQDLTRMFGI